MHDFSKTALIFFKVPEPPKKPLPEEVVAVPVPKKVEPPPAKGRLIFLKKYS